MTALQDGAAAAFEHNYGSAEEDPEFQLLRTEGIAAGDAVGHLGRELRRIERDRLLEHWKTSGSLDGWGPSDSNGHRRP